MRGDTSAYQEGTQQREKMNFIGGNQSIIFKYPIVHKLGQNSMVNNRG
jgi:hypothetical protein